MRKPGNQEPRIPGFMNSSCYRSRFGIAKFVLSLEAAGTLLHIQAIKPGLRVCPAWLRQPRPIHNMQIKVAIVDDDEGIRSSLSVLIKRAAGFKLTGEYANGETALKEIPKNLPDVVLMDINLPGMKGYECVRQLKAAHPALQFLMLTVYSRSEERRVGK